MNVSQTACILGDSKNLDEVLKNIEHVENPDTVFIKFEDNFDSFLKSGITKIHRPVLRIEKHSAHRFVHRQITGLVVKRKEDAAV